MTAPTLDRNLATAALPVRAVRFPVMGTLAHVLVVDGSSAALDAAVGRLRHLGTCWDVADPDSEIAAINNAKGQPVAVSVDTLLLARLASTAGRRSDGRYTAVSGGAVGIDLVEGTVALTAGARLEPGDLVRGLAADLTAAAVLDAGAAGVLVNVGGNLRAAGEPPIARGWTLDVEDPFSDDPVARLHLINGAVATAARHRRSWGAPRTAYRAGDGVASVTAIARLAWEAEMAARTALSAGGDALEALDEWPADGLAVWDDRSVSTTLTWPG
ncbi:MAG TPA: FAD:protein FMN transferase [Mycobacteriales bacterium]|nr:FAD:protein FMN transferase [Mycobacteriales bacterium]